MDFNVTGTAASAAATTYKTAAIVEDAKTVNAEEQESEQTAKTAQKSESYKPDMEKINQMKADMGSNMTAFKQMVFSMIKEQGTTFEQIFGGKVPLKIDSETQAKAQAAIAEDGYWGVEQTAGRILEFAKALSGGDPSKIEGLRNAVKAGFGAAGKVWGGELPSISQQTYDRVMKGFDEWENPPEVQAEAEE